MRPLLWRRWRRAPPPMPIIVGSGRCGSTLLRLMLDSHPRLAIPPETGFLPRVQEQREALGPEALADFLVGFPTWSDFHLDEGELRRRLRRITPFSASEGIRCFYRMYARRQGKPRWGDKTPTYVHHLLEIQELLPEAHFVHLVRDGRDVALSLRRVWFTPGQDAATLARYWRSCVEAARAAAPGCRRFLEIRYEDLLRDPVAVLQRVCELVELPWSPSMLEYPTRAERRLGEVQDRVLPEGRVITRGQRLEQQALSARPPRLDRIGGWRDTMSPGDVATFDEIAGDLLEELGYGRAGGSGGSAATPHGHGLARRPV